MDVDFMLDDLLETLRPKGRPKGVKDGPVVNRLRTFGDAATAVDAVLAANAAGKLSHITQQLTADHDDDDDEEEERGDEGGGGRIDDSEDEFEEVRAQDAAEDDDDVVVLREQKKELDEYDERAQGDFDRDFARMLADTTVDRKAAPPVFDQAVPMFRKRQQNGTSADESNMQFMLLSKKGNKPQVSCANHMS